MNIRNLMRALLCLAATVVSAQERPMVNGRVVDAEQGRTPVAYATLQGMNADSLAVSGTVTDAEGRFSLPVGGVAWIEISFLGYETLRLTPPFTPEAADSLVVGLRPAAIELGALTVRGTPHIARSDRRLIVPSAAQTARATDGADLLRKLQLPRLTVHPLTGALTLAGGGTVSLRIDGVEASEGELAALKPEDVVRIDYHDAPGVRYAGADAVVDCITRRARTAATDLALQTLDAVGSGKWASISHLALRRSRAGKAWALQAGYMGQERRNWVRDYEEAWHYPDRTVDRRELGEPVGIGGSMLESSAEYIRTRDDGSLFNVRLGFDWQCAPASEEGDRHTTLFASDAERPTDLREHTASHSLTPSLALCWQRALGGGARLTIDATATLIATRSRHTYREQAGGELLTDLRTDVDGRKRSVVAEAVYERRSGRATLTAGLRHLQARADNRYAGTTPATVRLGQARTDVFGEWSGAWGPWTTAAGLTLVRTAHRQDGLRRTDFGVEPSVRLAFEPEGGPLVRYTLERRTLTPPIASLSDAEQPLQAGLIRRGNPDLHAWSAIGQRLGVGWERPLAGIDLVVGYRRERRPAVELVRWTDGLFVRTFDHQPSFSRLSAEAAFRLSPWRDRLTLTLTPVVYRYFSRTADRCIARTQARLKVDADFAIGPWTLAYNTLTGAANAMQGEEWIEESDMSLLLAGYKRARWSVQAGVFNPFLHEYWMQTVNRSAVAPFVSRAHSSRPAYAALRFCLRFGGGRAEPSDGRRPAAADRDAGILPSTR